MHIKQNSTVPLRFFQQWAVPFAIVLIVALAVYKLVSGERQYIPVKASLKQISTLQSLHHMKHRFYTTDLDAIGFFPVHDGYTYSVIVATDASFVVQAVRQKENFPDVWQINETGTIRRIVQE